MGAELSIQTWMLEVRAGMERFETRKSRWVLWSWGVCSSGDYSSLG